MGDRDQDSQAERACRLSMKGHSLSEIAQALDVEPDTVLSLIAKKTQLSKYKVKKVFDSMERVFAIKSIMMPRSIPAEALKLFVPDNPQTEQSSDSIEIIERHRRERLPAIKPSSYFGVASGTPSTTVTELPEPRTSGRKKVPRMNEEEKRTEPPKRKVPKLKEAGDKIEPLERRGEEAPQYIYSYMKETSWLFRTKLSSGRTLKGLVNHRFRTGSALCEVAGGDIYFTGGCVSFNNVNEVVWVRWSVMEVTAKAPMLSTRSYHGSVHDNNYLYAFGGMSPRGYVMAECERLSVSEDRWEALQPLPQGCSNATVVVMKEMQCLYALGGWNSGDLDTIQRLRLGRLEWDSIPLRLPSAASNIACFSSVSKVWFVVKEKLYCLNAAHDCAITLIKNKVANKKDCWGPCYYHSGKMYCSNHKGTTKIIKIGSL